MTREEHIIYAKNLRIALNMMNTFSAETMESLDEAIKALEQHCEDAVSRQAVLSKIKEVCFSEEWLQFRVDNGSNGQRDFLINYIENLLPVTPTQKWIPVSERLPEKNGKYLAYIINKKDTNLQYIMTCEYYDGDLWNWFPDDDCASDNVVAWMPLPRPYKAESEDKE